MPHIALEAILSIQRLQLMHVFLVFALRVWGHLGEAGVLAEGNETEHDFDGDENNDDGTDCS